MQNVRLGLHDPISRTKPPVVEYDYATAQWRVWTAYNPSMTIGTFINLHPGGNLSRRTIAVDGTLSIINM